MGTTILRRRHLLDEPPSLLHSALPSTVRLCFTGDDGGAGGGGGGSSDGGGDDGGDDGEGDDADDEVDWKARAQQAEKDRDRWKGTSRKHEERAKKNAAAARRVEELESGQQGDQEKAIAAARREERENLTRSYGGRLVQAEFRARAAGRMDDGQLDALLDVIDPSRFLDDDGEVDTDMVRDHVDKIAPPKKKDDDGGGRNGSARGGAGMGQGRTQRGRDGRGGGGTAAGASRYEQRKAARQPAGASSDSGS